MIIIGVTQRALQITEHGERRDGLDRRWHRFLWSCGITAIPLVNDQEIAIQSVITFKVQGLLLSGGDDLVSYGGDPSGRDETEYLLLRWAINNNIPVLGVCRGMQIILDSFGSKLQKIDGHVGCQHEIKTINGSRTVNSFHKWAAFQVSKPFTVTATCGSVIEAIECKEANVYGIMWHPERESPFDPLDQKELKKIFGG